MDFQTIRKEYEDQGIEVEQLDANPIRQLQWWLDEATANRPGPWFESNAMALATAGRDGHVSVRQVLLKGVTDEGVRFFTNYESAKGKQLAENPNCSVCLHWPFLGRQIRITGIAERVQREVSQQYFHSRPRGSQLGAAISNQSRVIASRAELEQRMNDKLAEIGEGVVPLPDHWGGYLIRPREFEFWQGRSNRLHDRIVYQGEPGNWQIMRLAP